MLKKIFDKSMKTFCFLELASLMVLLSPSEIDNERFFKTMGYGQNNYVMTMQEGNDSVDYYVDY